MNSLEIIPAKTRNERCFVVKFYLKVFIPAFIASIVAHYFLAKSVFPNEPQLSWIFTGLAVSLFGFIGTWIVLYIWIGHVPKLYEKIRNER